MNFVKKINNCYKIVAQDPVMDVEPKPIHPQDVLKAVNKFYYVAKKEEPKTPEELLDFDIGVELPDAEMEKAALKAFKLWESQLEYAKKQKQKLY